MVAPYPETDARGVKELRADLEREVVALVPALSHPPRDGEFGHAFYELALRMAAQVTTRLNRTAQRDAIAFFDALDIPPMAPRAAEAPLVFTLAEKKDEPVVVPKGTQVGADTDGDEVIFETLHDLTLTPARLEHLAAVDVDKDIIEEAPANIRSTEPPAGPFPTYHLTTFAEAGSTTIQITPAVGLEEGDLIRIGENGQVYRVAQMQGDLCTIEPKLVAPADPETTEIKVEKVTRFDAFTLRDIQAHQVYIGHSELLNLEQRASITLVIEPASVMRRLGDMEISAALWGTPDRGQTVGGEVIAATGGDDPKPDWRPLDFEGVGQDGITFIKSWTGKVEKFEVRGEKSLWLRLVLDEKIPNRAETGTRVNTLKLKIQSIADPGAPDPNLIEGSETVERAFHNSTPLSVGTRFLPFGPEPQRFDTFSLAAPEALSKKGATVTLRVELVDSTIEALTMTSIASGPPRAYAIGRNGGLQALAYDASPVRWQQIEQPKKLPTGSASDAELRLDQARPLQAIQIDVGDPNPLDLIIACDKGGRIWAQTIVNQHTSGIFEPQGWHLIWPLTANDTAKIQDLVLLKSVPGTGLPTPIAISVATDGVRLLALTSAGTAAASAWTLLNPGTINVPALDGAPYHRCALVAVQSQNWAASPNVVTPEVVLVDSAGKTWIASVGPGNVSIAWSQIIDLNISQQLDASPEIRPAAVRNGALFLAAASLTDELFALSQGVKRSPPGPPITVLKDSAILCLPRHQDFARFPLGPVGGSDQPVVAAFGDQAGQITAFLWTHPVVSLDSAGRVFSTSLPANSLSTLVPKATWVPGANLGTDLPTLILGGTGESILKAPLVRARQNVQIAALHDVVRAPLNSAPDYVELNPSTLQSVVVPLAAADLVISDGTATDYYKLARSVGLAAGDQYRFLKILATFTSGPVVSTAQLPLAATDLQTQSGSVLVINQIAYAVGVVVTSVSATTTPALPATLVGLTVSYEVMQPPSANVIAASGDIATLVELTATPTARLAGISIPGGVPVTSSPVAAQSTATAQSIAAAQNKWLLLAAAWTTIPFPATNADLIEEFILGNWSIERLERGYQNPELAWEYFDGRGWQPLADSFQDGTNHLAASGDISFAVPDDLSQTDVGAQKDYWVRASLIGGDYGRAKYVVTNTTPDPAHPETTTQTITVDTSNLHPPEILSIEASFKLDEEVPPELVLVENNGAVLNQTQAAAEAQASFELFEGLLTLDPKLEARSIFLGFSKRFDVDPLTLYADADEQDGEGTLEAAVLTQKGWSVVRVEDETAAFRRRGFVRIPMREAPVRAALFGRDLYWLRLAPKSVTDWKPRIKGLYVNAIAAEQAKTVVQEILGSSVGEPNQVYPLSEKPVILREAAAIVHGGAPAPLDVELRVRESLSDEERDALKAEPSRGDVGMVATPPDIPGDWVLWQRTDTFIGHDGDARIFRLDPANGTVAFGDGQQGKIPPAGRDGIRAFRYQQGGGKQGNVEAYAIKNLKSALESVEAVTNPVEATGGIDAPDIEQLIATAPTRLRNANRALSGADMEALAISSSPDVVRARHIMPRNAKDKMRLAVAVRTGQPNPRPSIARRKALAKYILEHAAGMLEPDALYVVPPEYVPVTVTVGLLAESADVMSEVEGAASKRLAAFLDPIDGGPDGKGWPFGRRIWPSDVYRIVSAIPGVDRITAVEIVTDSGVDLDRLPAAALICAAENGLKVNVETGGMT